MSVAPKRSRHKLLIGRHEWCALPALGLPAIKAKIDTGARTSALHAFNIKPMDHAGELYVSFDIHPIQANKRITRKCHALVIDQREIMSSNGHKEHRFVISTALNLGGASWDIEVTLSNRDPLRYRMLLGIEALKHRVIVDPSLTCHQGAIKEKEIQRLYTEAV